MTTGGGSFPPKNPRRAGCVIYPYVPEAKWFFMLDVYSKDEKDDLSEAERKMLSKLTTELKQQAKTSVSRSTRRKK